MNILDMVFLLLVHSDQISGRHRRDSSSSEEGSIENLLYYQESKQKTTPPPPPPPTAPAPVPLKLHEERPACPCPKMCCSMCCECNDRPPSSFMLRQMQPQMQPPMPPYPAMQQQPIMQQRSMMHPPPGPNQPSPMQPPVQHKPRTKKKKTPPLLPPIGSRRDMGSTYKEHIRGLISHDQDIKKILQDLVKVTIKKVNLLEEIGSKGIQFNSHDDANGNGNDNEEVEEEEVQEFEL